MGTNDIAFWLKVGLVSILAHVALNIVCTVIGALYGWFWPVSWVGRRRDRSGRNDLTRLGR